MNKLNFGCGSIQPKSWINLDSDRSFEHQVNSYNFLFRTETILDNSFDIIVAHAVVQQFEWHDLVKQLSELHRVLKPGGVIRISLPDIEEGFRQLQSGNRKWFPNTEEKLTDEAFCAWITWYSTSKTLLTRYCLKLKLEEVGFRHVRPVEFKQTSSAYPESVELDTRQHEFYFMEAVK